MKDEVPDGGGAPPEVPRAKRKYTRCAKPEGEQHAKTTRKSARKGVEPTLSFFINEENNVTVCRADGEGEATEIPAADALRLVTFIERHRGALECT